MQIRAANLNDLPEIENIYSDARKFMREAGNLEQWAGGYPERELIISDIESERLYVAFEKESILAVFVYFFGEDSTYLKIYNGKWKNDKPYGVIHRIAVSKNAHGMGASSYCFNFAYEKCGNLKIDTHKDNIPMQKTLSKNGFEYCGIIYLEDGGERIAFQKCD